LAPADGNDFVQQLRYMNEALLLSSIRQHELVEKAEKAEAALRVSEARLRYAANVAGLTFMEVDLESGEARKAENFGAVMSYAVRNEPESDVFEDTALLLEHVVTEDRVRVNRALEDFLVGKPVGKIEYRVLGDNRIERWIESRWSLERDGNGKPLKTFAIHLDITERKLAEATLRASEEQRRLALDAAELGTWHLDPATMMIAADERMLAIFGTTAELDFESVVAMIHPDDRERIRDAVAAATRPDDPAPYAIEYRVFHSDGSVRWVFAKGRAIFRHGETGRVLASFDGTVTDITERKLLEHKTQAQALALADLHRRKDEFLAMLSHELRSPIAPISNAVHLLRLQSTENSLQKQARSIIERQVGQLTRLVDDLMEVSRITTGRIHLRKERIVIGGIIERAVETAFPMIEQRHHTLTVRVPPEPIWLDADAGRLEQVIVNLLTNAAKYTEEGGSIWLTVSNSDECRVASDESNSGSRSDECRVTSGESNNGEGRVASGESYDSDLTTRHSPLVTIRVRDTGVGIAPGLLPCVFDLFTQAERSLDRSQGGLGIGLALVQRLVEMHGGTVEVTSTLGKGSEFVVRLPSATLATDHSPLATNHSPLITPLATALKVLIVDDNEDSAETLAILLKALKHDVRTANDGLAALETATRYRPDVVLLDIGLPMMDGYEVAAKMRLLPAHKTTVLVALTGYGQDSDRQKSKDAGFDHHLVKPADFAKLQQILTRASERAVGVSPLIQPQSWADSSR